MPDANRSDKHTNQNHHSRWQYDYPLTLLLCVCVLVVNIRTLLFTACTVNDVYICISFQHPQGAQRRLHHLYTPHIHKQYCHSQSIAASYGRYQHKTTGALLGSGRRRGAVEHVGTKLRFVQRRLQCAPAHAHTTTYPADVISLALWR